MTGTSWLSHVDVVDVEVASEVETDLVVAVVCGVPAAKLHDACLPWAGLSQHPPRLPHDLLTKHDLRLRRAVIVVSWRHRRDRAWALC